MRNKEGMKMRKTYLKLEKQEKVENIEKEIRHNVREDKIIKQRQRGKKMERLIIEKERKERERIVIDRKIQEEREREERKTQKEMQIKSE